MIIGIKYMLGSTEQRAEYKRTMLPYLIGAIMLFAAVNLTTFVYNLVGLDESFVGDGEYNFDERMCSSCGNSVIPTFSIEKHTYICPRCGSIMPDIN